MFYLNNSQLWRLIMEYWNPFESVLAKREAFIWVTVQTINSPVSTSSSTLPRKIWLPNWLVFQCCFGRQMFALFSWSAKKVADVNKLNTRSRAGNLQPGPHQVSPVCSHVLSIQNFLELCFVFKILFELIIFHAKLFPRWRIMRGKE